MSAFEVRIEGDARVVVRGELDMATSPVLTSAVESLAGTGARRIVIDLSGVTFLDSSGVSALCLAKSELGETVLVLGGVSTPVDTVLRIAGLEREFVRETSPS